MQDRGSGTSYMQVPVLKCLISSSRIALHELITCATLGPKVARSTVLIPWQIQQAEEDAGVSRDQVDCLTFNINDEMCKY